MNRKVRYIIILLALLGAFGFSYAVFFPTVGYKQNKAEDLFRRGYLLYNNYQYDASIEFFLDSLAYNPDFRLSRRMAGQALYFSGRTDEAISEWKVIFENGGYDPSLKLHLQNLRSVRGEEASEWVFQRTLKGETGYRFSMPVFTGSLPNHNVFFLNVGDIDAGSMIELGPEGRYRRNLRRISGKLEAPMGAAHSETEIWITDFKRDIIHRMPLGGGRPLPLVNEIDPLFKKGTAQGEFLGPAGICYRDGFFFIVDSGNNRVQKFNTSGGFIMQFDKVKAGFRLNGPFGIACHPDGTIYVSEPEEGRLSVFDRYGNFLRYEGHDYLKKPRHIHLNTAKNMMVVADEQAGVFVTDLSTGKRFVLDGYEREDGSYRKFSRPYSAVIDFFGNIYVADYAGHELVHFVPEQFLYSNLEIWVERINAATFPNVGMYVSVRDHYGNYITDLTHDHFKVFENGAGVGNVRSDYLQQFADRDQMVMLISRSQTMKNYSESLLWAADFYLDNLREKDRVQVISYADSYRIDSPATNSRLRIRKAILASRENDYSNDTLTGLGSAVYSSISELLPRKGMRSLLWINEGYLPAEGLQKYNFARLATYARVNHIPVFIISFENPDLPNFEINREKLKKLARSTGGRYYSAFGSLTDLTEKIRAVKQKRYVVNYKSGAKSEWHNRFMDVKLEVDFQYRKGFERTGYFIPPR